MSSSVLSVPLTVYYMPMETVYSIILSMRAAYSPSGVRRETAFLDRNLIIIVRRIKNSVDFMSPNKYNVSTAVFNGGDSKRRCREPVVTSGNPFTRS